MESVQKLQRVIQPIYFKCPFREEKKPFSPPTKADEMNYIPSVPQLIRGFFQSLQILEKPS